MFEFLTDLFNDYKPKPTKETIVVAKPMCIPARKEVTRIFNEYGVKILQLKEEIEFVKFNGSQVPGLYIAKVTVSSKQAVWAEYLLLRSQKFMLMSKPKNKRNLEWAMKHEQMPQSWNGKPLIEVGCNEGLEAIKKVKKNK